MTKVWTCLEQDHGFTPETLAETLIGGQAFRWYYEETEDCWTGVWNRHVASLRLGDKGNLEARARTPETTLGDIRQYLGLDRLPALVAGLPCNADPVLNRLYTRWRGLSILRQPRDETVLAFICSSNKQILQIRAMLTAMSLHFGEPVHGTPFHRLPGWEKLASVKDADLRACSLGYRAAHVAGTARFLAGHPDYLRKSADLPTDSLRSALCQLPGVGPKVADCILLFAYGRTEAFPVDTWIEKILKASYPGLAGWSRPQLATFARIHFGQGGGLAQQWFFAEARSRSKSERKKPETLYRLS